MKNLKTTQLEIWPNRGPKKVFSLQDQYTIGEQAMRIWKINNCEELSRCDSKFSWLFYDEISEDPMFGVTGLNETKQMDFRLFEHPWEWKLVSTFDGSIIIVKHFCFNDIQMNRMYIRDNDTSPYSK